MIKPVVEYLHARITNKQIFKGFVIIVVNLVDHWAVLYSELLSHYFFKLVEQELVAHDSFIDTFGELSGDILVDSELYFRTMDSMSEHIPEIAYKVSDTTSFACFLLLDGHFDIIDILLGYFIFLKRERIVGSIRIPVVILYLKFIFILLQRSRWLSLKWYLIIICRFVFLPDLCLSRFMLILLKLVRVRDIALGL